MEEIDAQFDACLARNAACVLAGIKPAALFNFAPRGVARPAANDALRRESHRLALAATRRLAAHGVRTEVLLVHGMRALLLVSRPDLVERTIADPDVRAFLTRAGYACDCAPRVVSCLRRRLRLYEQARSLASAGSPCDDCPSAHGCRARNPWRRELAYPHEMGVLLGYPLADVRAFIERQGRGAARVGTWKVYGDVEAARQRWEQMRACEQDALARFEQGATLEELAA